MTRSSDLLDTLADITPGSPLALARATRDAATLNIARSREALFNGASDLTRAERLHLAREVARWHEDEALSAHYSAALQDEPVPPARLSVALGHAEILTFHPVQATAQEIAALTEAGFSEEAIVTLAQVVAFVSFESRLLRGYRLINGGRVAGETAIPPAGRWHPRPPRRADNLHPPPSRRMNWAGSRGLHRNRSPPSARMSRRRCADSGIRIPGISACWHVTCPRWRRAR